MLSATELIMAVSLLGASDGFVERNFEVIIVSAQADQIHRVQIEKRLPNATFFYATEDTPTSGSSPYGHVSLLNESDNEPTIAAQFQLAGTVHSVTFPADKFLEGVRATLPALDTGLYLVNQAGQPVTSLALERLDKDTLTAGNYFLMPRTPSAENTPNPTFTYPNALKSVAVYFRSKAEAAKLMEQWAPGYAGPKQTRPTDQAWTVGAEAFAQHFSTSSLSVSITERLRKAKEEIIPVGDYALVSHVLQESGAIVLPTVRNRRTVGSGEKNAPLLVPKVTKTQGKITGFSVDAEVFIQSVIRPHLEGVPSDAKLLCHQNPQKQAGWACVADTSFPSGYAIRFTQVAAKPVEMPFYLVQADTSRRWKIDLTFNQAAPTLSDPSVFPISLPEGP
jgi:hypothetical protein